MWALLAGLILAITSWGFVGVSPANADDAPTAPQPAATSNLEVNFIPADGKTIADYDMWVWSSGSDARVIEFSSTTPEGWLNAVIDTSAATPAFENTTNLNVIVREGKAWGGWQTSDLAVTSPSQVWIDSATPSLVTTTPPSSTEPAPTSVDITVHYVRYDDSYPGWNIWTWLPGQDGYRVDFDANQTATWTVENPAGVTSVGLIVRKSVDGNDWAQKNSGDDLFITNFPDGAAEVWIVQGNPTIFTSPADLPEAPDTRCLDLHTDAFNDTYYYDGELGAIYTPTATTFRLWAPTAESVAFLDYTGGDTPVRTEMTAGEKGTWEHHATGDAEGTIYNYELTFADGTVTESMDPYARASTANSQRTVVVDVENLNPVGWNAERMPAFSSIQDATIYEAHIRDLTIGADNGIENKGKFLGLTEGGTTTSSGNPTGLDYIDSLGVTHVQFLPMYDFGSINETGDLSYGAQYNWGYDPMNYNVPEGSYSTDPTDPEARIVEMKSMVDAIHDRDMYVIMDVVYNHVYSPASSPLQKTVPDYYFRMDDSCSFYNGTGVGNETASEQPMMRKYMVDSIVYWADVYNIDGFRFDLMGIHDVQTMNEIRAALNEIDPSIVVLGEGWAMGNHPDGVTGANQYNADLLPGISFFNDSFRDTVKGDNFVLANKGYVNDGGASGWDVWNNLIGAQYVRDYQAPYQSVVYNEAHDNYTMYDKLKGSLPGASEDEIVRRHTLATSLQFLANGTNFVHAGQEFLRTKYGDHNSYASPDFVNEFTYDRAAEEQYAPAVEYFRDLQEFRTNNDWLRLDSYEKVNAVYRDPVVDGQHLSYRVTPQALGGAEADHFVFVNAGSQAWPAEVPAGSYDVLISDMSVLDTPERITSSGTIEVPALSVVVLKATNAKVTVTATAEWVDELGNPLAAGLTPETARVDVTNGAGEPPMTFTLQKAGGWSATSSPSVGVGADGAPIEFTLVPEAIDGFAVEAAPIGAAVAGNAAGTLTYTLQKSAVTVSATTAFTDADGAALDPAQVPAGLQAAIVDSAGAEVGVLELADGTVASEKLRRYDSAGAEVAYSLGAVSVAGFTVTLGEPARDGDGNVAYAITVHQDAQTPEPEPAKPVQGSKKVAASVAEAKALSARIGGLDTLVVASYGGNVDDAAAAELATQLGTVVVYTHPTKLSAEIVELIAAEGITEVHVMGGPDAIAKKIESQLVKLGLEVARG